MSLKLLLLLLLFWKGHPQYSTGWYSY